MVGQRLLRVGDEEGVVEGEFDGDVGRRGRQLRGGLGEAQRVFVEAQGAEAQLRGLAEEVEELGGVEAEVAIVQAAQAALVVGSVAAEREVLQLVLDALALEFGGIERPADVLGGVLVAEVRDGQPAGLTTDLVAPGDALGCDHVVGSGVLERAQQPRLETLDELLELAHHPGEGRRVEGV